MHGKQRNNANTKRLINATGKIEVQLAARQTNKKTKQKKEEKRKTSNGKSQSNISVMKREKIKKDKLTYKKINKQEDKISKRW